MNRSVLIIDDDEEFSQLLKGIYEQADYTVHTAVNSDVALEIIRKKPIQLVVTDQRLPGGMSGSDLISKFREMDLKVPVIMVSGFLNDDAIRDLIRDGIEGVFIKPLNVFSLLKKSSEILEERLKGSIRSTTGEGVEKGSNGPSRPIGHIEGESGKGQAFVERAHAAASFKRNLLLIGPPGTLFEEISRDIVSLAGETERCVAFKPGQVGKEVLCKLVEGDLEDRPLTLVLLDAEHLSTEEVDQLISFGDEHGGSASSLRMIFCLSKSVESLYDAETIDEELYLFLGSNELKVPPLKEMPEDLLAIAKKAILEQAKEATFDTRLRSFFLDYDWPENMLELRSVIIRASSLAQPMPPTVRHFEAALHPERGSDQAMDGMRSSLERFLANEKSRYLASLNLLQNA